MSDTSKWVDAVLDALEGCIEGYGPGSFDLRFIAEESHLIVAPATIEMVGGAEDGEEICQQFSIHLAELAKKFDAMPEISWDTMYDELHIDGEINGEDAWITFQKFPIEDNDEPQWLLERGRLRRRKSDE